MELRRSGVSSHASSLLIEPDPVCAARAREDGGRVPRVVPPSVSEWFWTNPRSLREIWEITPGQLVESQRVFASGTDGR